MKFLVTVLIALWSLPVFSFSLTEFAAAENSGKPDGFIHWHGSGTMMTAPSGETESFLVSLMMRNLGDHVILFQYRIISENFEHHPHFVARVEDNGFFTIYVPVELCGMTDKESPHVGCKAPLADDAVVNLAKYNKGGWGYSVGNSMYFDYKASGGQHSMQHYRSYHDEQGNFRLASTGSMGTDTEGLKFTWTEDLKRIFVHRP